MNTHDRPAVARAAAVKVAAAWILLPLFFLATGGDPVWWNAWAYCAVLLVFVFRIRNEEEVLVRGLAGYDEYRRQVRYRLVPFVW